jgi:hypothetical protein
MGSRYTILSNLNRITEGAVKDFNGKTQNVADKVLEKAMKIGQARMTRERMCGCLYPFPLDTDYVD